MSFRHAGGQPQPLDRGPATAPLRATIERRVRAIDRRSCEASFLDRRGVAQQCHAKPGQRVVQAGTGSPRRNFQELGDLHQREADVVMQDEDRTLLERQLSKRSLELVTVGDPRVLVEADVNELPWTTHAARPVSFGPSSWVRTEPPSWMASVKCP